MALGVENKHKILIVSASQFGYHTDTLMYCKYIDKLVFDIHYIGFDLGKDRFHIDEVKVHYIPCHNNKLIRHLNSLKSILKLNKQNNFDLIFHVHTKFSFFIRLIFLSKNYILDIRTGDLNDNKLRRHIKNGAITFLSMLTKHVTVISDGLANKLHISQHKQHIIPLGGETIDIQGKDFFSLRLLYVGTLSKRNIHETVDGLALFMAKYPNVSIEYDIVGNGYVSDLKKINDTIKKHHLNDTVHLHGYIKHSELTPFLTRANIGIVYIPQFNYYQNQPSTKLYEYMLAGMPVIATNTLENRKEITKFSGIICEDNSESFSKALDLIYQNRMNYNSSQIKNLQMKSTWKNIVQKNVEPFFKKIIRK